MSHFTVLVAGNDHEAMLAPYDENLEVPRRMVRTRAQIIADTREWMEDIRCGRYAEYLANPTGYAATHGDHTIPYLRDRFPKLLERTDEEIWRDETDLCDVDDEGNEYSTSNPDAKWDWWVIGGRWSGGLTSADGAHVDQALRADLDVDNTRTTYAVLTADGWHARAEMGWFGLSHDEEHSEEEWPAEWRRIVAGIPGNTLLTLIDCHI